MDRGGEGKPMACGVAIGVWTPEGESATFGDCRGDWTGSSRIPD